jgi:iron-sulfur cluster assembly accessory protein
MIEITNEAITKILEKQAKEKFAGIRLGITGGGCAGFEYVFDRTDSLPSEEDVELDYGKFRVLINKISVPYLVGMTLDYQKEGLNEVFKFINPKEQSSCGCGVSINFDLEQVQIDKDKIFAVEL